MPSSRNHMAQERVDASAHTGLRRVLWLLLGMVMLFVVVWQAPGFYEVQGLASYLPLHIFAEMFSIVVAFLVFGVAWNAYSAERSGNIMILACALLAVGLIDFAHMLSYKGMPAFITPSGPEKAINLWLSARLIAALALLVAAWRSWRPLSAPRSRYALLAGSLAVAVAVIWFGVGYPQYWPHTFIAGKGLTPFKIDSEYAIVAILLVPAVRFYRQARSRLSYDAVHLFAATVITILSELSFTFYSDVADIFNLLGHFYKIVAYAFIYRAVFVASVREPYRRLHVEVAENKRIAKELRRSRKLLKSIVEHVPAMIFLKSADELRFELFNRAGEKLLGYDREDLLGKNDYDFFPKKQADFFTGKDRAVLESHKVLEVFEEPIKTAGGDEKWLHTFKVGLYDDEGRPTHLLGISMDVTERKRADEELLRLNRVLRTLSEGNRAMLRARDEVELMHATCQVLIADGGYVLSWIGLAGEKGIEPVAVAGEGESYVEALRLDMEGPPEKLNPVAAVLRGGRLQIVQDTMHDPHYAPWRGAAAKCGYASLIALPLKDKGETFGTLNIYASEASVFNRGEVRLLEEMAADLAFGIVSLRSLSDRDRAIADRQRYAERLRISLEKALQAIAATVEKRDPYTAGHQRRVADLAAAIAREMKLPEEQVHGIRLAGIVHDLGKISIPAEILSKPGELTEIERELVKAHPQAGYEILQGIEFPWPIAQTVLQHHERFDGSGYPQGLKDDAIILEARILAVADVVEAVSSHRPYRPGKGVEAALEEIAGQRGILFDPEVVNCCLILFREKRFAFEL